MKPFTIAKVLVVNAEGKILALRRSSTDERRPLQWDFPGGFVEADEDPVTAAIRETEEEAGIKLAEVQLVFGMSEPEPEKNISGTWLVFVSFVGESPAITLSSEHDIYAWIEPDELLAQITYDRQRKMLGYAIDNGLLRQVA